MTEQQQHTTLRPRRNLEVALFAIALGIATVAAVVARREPTVYVLGRGSVPDPPGARSSSLHYLIRMDSNDEPGATSTSALAERYHERLASYFGAAPLGKLPVIVCSDPKSFARYANPPAVGVYSEAPRFAVVSDFRQRREQVLAHELVHGFVHGTIERAPYWIDEGLACELSHGDDEDDGGEGPPCPARLAASLEEKKIVAIARTIDSWNEEGCADETARMRVACALVRFGLETQGWRDLRAALSFKPDLKAFLEWLGEGPTHDRFAPLLELEKRQKPARERVRAR